MLDLTTNPSHCSINISPHIPRKRRPRAQRPLPLHPRRRIIGKPGRNDPFRPNPILKSRQQRQHRIMPLTHETRNRMRRVPYHAQSPSDAEICDAAAIYQGAPGCEAAGEMQLFIFRDEEKAEERPLAPHYRYRRRRPGTSRLVSGGCTPRSNQRRSARRQARGTSVSCRPRAAKAETSKSSAVACPGLNVVTVKKPASV